MGAMGATGAAGANGAPGPQGAQGPPGPVNVFTATQNAPITTVGLAWTFVPGAAVSFSLNAAGTLDLSADGSVYGVAATNYQGGHCGFRFLVDNQPTGDATWGDRIIGCAASGTPYGWWCNWSAHHTVPVGAGNHNVALQRTGWSGTNGGCADDGGSYGMAKLYVLAR